MAIHKVDGVNGANNFPKKFVTLYASSALTKGEWVAIDVTTATKATNGLGASVKVAETDVAGGPGGTFGVATETVTIGNTCRIQTAGLCDFAKVKSDTTAGEALCASAVNGEATQSNTDPGQEFHNVGVALEAYVSTGTSVMIIDQGYF